MSHNFFDDEKVFKEYVKMRNDINPTDIIEKPAMKNLLPKDLSGKTILDVCCGYGEMSKYFIRNGAKLVVAIDISEKMIEKARKENNDKNILYICSDIMKLNEKFSKQFDIIYSSFAFHFIEDLDLLFSKLYKLLKKDGKFIFSMEHPIMTSPKNTSWNVDENNEIVSYNFSDYYSEEYKKGFWFSTDINVGVYHKKISTILNALIKNGFIIVKMEEPEPDKNKITKELYTILNLRPTTLIIECKK